MMLLSDLLFFSAFQLLVIYPLGKIILDFLEIKLWWLQNLIFGLIIGIIVLTLLVLGLGYTNNYRLLPVLVAVPPFLFLFQIRNIKFQRFNPKKVLEKADLFVIFAIALCVLIQSTIVFPNGITPGGELRVKGPFTEDGMWHVAIINNLTKSVPPENPLFSGEKLINYNYFSDIYITVVRKFTGIEILTLFFRLVGPFLAFLCATSLYFLLKALTKNKLISGLGVLLVTLGSTYYYLFAIIKPDFNFNPSTFYGNDYVSRMVNYQLSFSYLIITTFLYLLLSYKKIGSLKFSVIAAILIGSGIGFKSYGTILIIAALYSIGLYKVLKKDFSYLKIAILSSAFSLVIILLFLRNSGATESVFAFHPLWLINNIFTDPLRFGSAAWETKKNWYLSNSNYLGIGSIYLKGLAIFLFSNLGLKLLGFLYLLKPSEEKRRMVILLFSVIALMGIVIPLNFTQAGVGWNTIQFIWYSNFSLSILLVLLIADLQKRLGLKLVILIMLVVWSSFLPGVYYYTQLYLSDNNNMMVYNFQGTQEAYKAAKFLSSQPNGILLMDQNYSQTTFIVALTGKNAYFADESALSNMLINWQDRSKKAELFFSNYSTEDYKKGFLKENNISYVFSAKDRLKSEKYLESIYTNSEVSIYRIEQN